MQARGELGLLDRLGSSRSLSLGGGLSLRRGGQVRLGLSERHVLHQRGRDSVDLSHSLIHSDRLLPD